MIKTQGIQQVAENVFNIPMISSPIRRIEDNGYSVLTLGEKFLKVDEQCLVSYYDLSLDPEIPVLIDNVPNDQLKLMRKEMIELRRHIVSAEDWEGVQPQFEGEGIYSAFFQVIIASMNGDYVLNFSERSDANRFFYILKNWLEHDPVKDILQSILITLDEIHDLRDE